MSRPLIVELIGGPSVGKSMVAHGLMYKLKMAGITVEYIPERAKSFTWRGDMHTLSFQPYITSKQMRDVYDLCREENDIKVIVTDTSFSLGIVYQGFGCGPLFEEWLKSVQAEFDIHTYYLVRDLHRTFDPKGRRQTEVESIQVDAIVIDMLRKHNIPFSVISVKGDEDVEALCVKTIGQLRESSRI